MMKDVKGSCMGCMPNFTQPVCLQKECISLAFPGRFGWRLWNLSEKLVGERFS